MTAAEISAEEVAAGLRDFFADHPVLTTLRAALDDPDAPAWDAQTWEALAGQLGVTGLTVPAEHGGLELGAAAAVAASYEAGVGLYPGPLRSVLTAGYLLSRAVASDPVATLLTRLAAGEFVAAVALHAAPGVTYDGGRLTGSVPMVADGADADAVLVPVDENRVAVAAAGDVRVGALRSVDPSHRYADVEFDDVAAEIVSFEPAVLADALDVAQLLIAAEQAGGVAGCLFMAAEYARNRTQFGTPIATFQAIGHRCAELAVDLEGLRALLRAAAATADAGERNRLRALAPLTRAQASEVFCAAASTLVQVHGGIGFTWEHDAHLYFRRAHGLRDWAGTSAELRECAVRRNAVNLIGP